MVTATVKRWDGSAWVTATVRRWVPASTEPAAPAAAHTGTTGSTSLAQWTTGLEVDKMLDGDLGTYFGSNAAPVAGDHVTVDLGSSRQVGRVAVYQATASDPADMIHHLVLERSVDGSAWTAIGEYHDTAVVVANLPAAVQARYVRMRCTAPNPAGQWVRVREFVVAPDVVPSGWVTATVDRTP